MARGRIRSYNDLANYPSVVSKLSNDTSSSTQSCSVHSSSHSIDQNPSMNVYTTPVKETQEEQNPSAHISVAPLNNIPYVHGGYAAAAPLFMKDEKWMLLLQYLMPDEHLVLSNYIEQLIDEPEPMKVMKWAENNPVVAAYGFLHSKKPDPEEEQIESPPSSKDNDFMMDLANTKRSALAQVVINSKRNRKKQAKRFRHAAIEWDVFVDPTIVRDVDAAITKMNDLMKITDREVYDEEIIAANIEVDRQTSRLINRMMLAHGSAAQLLVEAVGVAARYNFSRVVKSGQQLRRKIEESKKESYFFGCSKKDTTIDENDEMHDANARNSAAKAMDVRTSAIFVDRWLHLFSSALKLGKQDIESIKFLVEKRKIRKDKVKKPRSFQHRTSALLRGALSSVSADNQLSNEYSPRNDEIEYENPRFCGLFLCLGMNDPDSLNVHHGDSSMAESASVIKKLLGGENLRLVLDMKSRHVPARVWGRLIDTLRSRGLDVDGIGSFDIDELRMIETRTSTPVTTIFFFHSAGDLQRACHANEIKYGDTVYFNAGSLMWKRQTICEATNCFSASKYPGLQQVYSEDGDQFDYLSFQPYAYPRESPADDEDINDCKATLADYQKRFDLNIGLYVQEFSIGSEELNLLVRLVNKYPSLYRCGLAWGGLNGVALKGVKGDGFWSQRYVGRNWSFSSAPARNMTLIAPEDHHAVQKAIMYGSCGQVTTVNNIMDDEEKIMCQNTSLLDFTQTGTLLD